MRTIKLFIWCFCIFCFLNGYSLTADIKIINAELLLDTKATLGEGSIWDVNEKVLYWIDIEKGILNSYNPADASNESFEMGKKIGTVVPVSSSKVVVALQDGIYTYDVNSSELNLLCQPFGNQSDVRFNDGKCDPSGRFWVGSMAYDAKSKIAALYCVDGEGKFRKMIENVIISNGLVWTSDKKTMYYIDTPTQKVMQYDFDNSNGTISNPRVAIDVPENIGHPDGMTIDKDDNIWVAMWGGACVAGFNPRTKKMIAKIEVPSLNVTSVAFGGDNLDILYITTASIGLDAAALTKYPNAGGLFTAKTGSIGLHVNYFKLK